MMFLRRNITLLLAGLTTCFASSIPRNNPHIIQEYDIYPRQSPPPQFSTSQYPTSQYPKPTPSEVPDPECTNGPSTRACWGDGYSVATDFDLNWPVTGHVVEYSLEITNTTLAPDGFERLVMAVNGQFPGPTIHAGTHILSSKRLSETNDIRLGRHFTDPCHE